MILPRRTFGCRSFSGTQQCDAKTNARDSSAIAYAVASKIGQAPKWQETAAAQLSRKNCAFSELA
jgi:hypothetical protein